jgi:hypothetical protein
MRKTIDGKFGIAGKIENGRASTTRTDFEIANLVSGEIIPKEEPLFLLRARDRNAIALLLAYRDLAADDGCNELHLAGIEQLLKKFSDFAKQYPERMKQPGITKHLKLEDTLDEETRKLHGA